MFRFTVGDERLSDRREDDLIAQCLYWFRHKLLTASTAAAVAMVIHSASGSLRYAAQVGSVMSAHLAQRYPCLRCSISLSNAAVACLRLSPGLRVALKGSVVPCDCGCSDGCILAVSLMLHCAYYRRTDVTDAREINVESLYFQVILFVGDNFL